MPHKRAKRSARDATRSSQGHDLAPASARELSTESIPKGIARVLDGERIRAEYRKRKAAGLDGDDGPKTGSANKKRKVGGDGDDRGEGKARVAKGGKAAEKEAEAKAKLTIQAGESLAHFNRRIEDNMRPLVRSAMSSASAHARATKKEAIQAKADEKKNKKKGTNTNDETSPEATSEKTDGEAQPGTKGTKSKPKSTGSAETDASTPTKDKDAPRGKTEFATTSTSAPRRLNDIAQAPPTFLRTPKERGNAATLARILGTDNKKATAGQRAEGVLSLAQRARMEEERERAVARYREMKAAKMKDWSQDRYRDKDGVGEEE